ncbi:MAG: transcriptional repressor LexA [bacterium]|nr:transcriptional repressor LexA [bacterium]
MPVIVYRKQRQILDFISQYIQKNGYSPTLAEIANAIGVKSLATVHEHLQALTKKKLIRKYEGMVRGIEVLEKRIGNVLEGVELPILGFIAAGQPIQTFTDPSASMTVSSAMISGKKPTYVLQVKGESMIEDGILDGDFVIVERQETARNGEIVVALLENGLATLKRFYKEADRIRLEPANSTMQPIYATDVQIQGKVVGVIRKYQ